MNGQLTRQLIWIPVVHAEADLGNMSELVQQIYVKRVGQAKWERHVEDVREFWARVQEAIEKLGLAWRRVRLYQDGLPNCGHEAEIVGTIAKSGSFNHQLLLKLIERGARIMGTESAALLIQEYELARQLLASGASAENGNSAGCVEQNRLLLDLRDRYIAERIRRTLRRGETGLIFLGMLHSLKGRLPNDIRVTQLCAEASFQGLEAEVYQRMA
jgi:hypothetical protein